MKSPVSPLVPKALAYLIIANLLDAQLILEEKDGVEGRTGYPPMYCCRKR